MPFDPKNELPSAVYEVFAQGPLAWMWLVRTAVDHGFRKHRHTARTSVRLVMQVMSMPRRKPECPLLTIRVSKLSSHGPIKSVSGFSHDAFKRLLRLQSASAMEKQAAISDSRLQL